MTAALAQIGKRERLAKAGATELNRVLIIDDDDFIRQTLASIARRAGYAFELSAGKPDEPAWSGAQPTLMMLDLRLSPGNGIDVLQRLVAAGLDAPVVLMSGCDDRLMQTAVTLATEMGCTVAGHMRKPLDVTAVRNLLDRHWRDSGEQVREQLATAIADEVLAVHYQPIVDIGSAKVIGAEALVRWPHPRRGMVPPLAFIPIAESCGLIQPLTRLVVRRAIRDWSILRHAGTDLELALNISPRALEDEGLEQVVEQALRDAAMPPERLTLEITETTELQTMPRATDLLFRLRIMGCRVALDDFGTGFSSLLALRNLPFTDIKIDRAFVHNAATRREERLIAEAVSMLGHKLDMRVIAEGIETSASLQAMREIQADVGQGYLFARPMPFVDLQCLATRGNVLHVASSTGCSDIARRDECPANCPSMTAPAPGQVQ